MTERRDKRGLGRGLSALMGELSTDTGGQMAVGPDQRRTVPIDELAVNPDQPRRTFPPDEIEELSESIRAHGVLQPLIVRPLRSEQGTVYQIVAGERRWRAAQKARLHEVPVIVRELDDDTTLQIALVENIQRADLGALEEAQAYQQLVVRFGHTQDHVATALGKSRSHVANMLRLLQLPEDVQTLLRDGRLSAGHARALLGAAQPGILARKVVAEGLSVRETEALVRGGRPARPRAGGATAEKDADTLALEAHLASVLRAAVSIRHEEGGGGRLSIRYRDVEHLDQICELLSSAH
mgnify:CR=1 FL=1